jgi:transposase
MKPLYRRIAGLDVHRMLYVLTVLSELDDGTVTKHQRSFGGFQRDLRDLVAWLLELGVELGVMESTGIYWKNVYAALEQAGIPAHVVNARHVKNVPGRKTDISDSEWLAQLGRFGLVRPSFIPPKDLRELRLVSRYRQKLAQTLAGEKNRLHKLLDDAGIKLGAVVSDIDGVSARAMIEGLIEGKPIAQLPELAKGALRTKRDTLERALEGELSPRHRLVLQQIQGHIRYLEIEMANLDTYLIDAMAPYADYWQLLQTLPGIDQISAAMILVEIGTDLPLRLLGRPVPRQPRECRQAQGPARPARATTPSATCCARRPMPQGEPTAPCATSIKAWCPAKATRRPSSPWPIKWSARSSLCSPAAKRIATLGLITKRSW